MAYQGPARLGITLQPMTTDLREYFGAPADHGVLISTVKKDSPAQAAGLRAGDVILELDGESVELPRDVIRRVARAAKDAELAIALLRDRKRETVKVKLAGEPVAYFDPSDPESWSELGRRFEHHLERGYDELLRRLDDLEKRLQELERSLEERRQGGGTI
jgi:membrane-associated protease RseP (regulator of RpoE activity)